MINPSILEKLLTTSGKHFFDNEFAPLLSFKDLISLSKTNKSFNVTIKNSYNLWASQIERHTHIKVELLWQFKNFCDTHKITIDYPYFFKNLYKHRQYFVIRPIKNFKLLYPFAFKNDFTQNTIKLFQLSDDEIENNGPHKRTLAIMACLLGNKELALRARNTCPAIKISEDEKRFLEASLAARGGHIKLALKILPTIEIEIILKNAILSNSIEILTSSIQQINNPSFMKKLEQKVSTPKIKLETVITAAIETDNIEILEFVINRYLNNDYHKYTSSNEKKYNLLHLAAKNNSTTIIKYLIEKYPEFLFEPTEDGELPICTASKHCPFEIVTLFLREEDKDKNTKLFDKDNSSVLWFAIINHDRRVFKHLVEVYGYNVRHIDKLHTNIIHHAARTGISGLEFLKEQKYFTPKEFNQLLNTPRGGIHIIELLIDRKTAPPYIANLVKYLEKHKHLDETIAKRISSNNLLTLFALRGYKKGVKLALDKLYQQPTKELMNELSNKIKTSNNSAKLEKIRKILTNHMEQQLQTNSQFPKNVIKKITQTTKNYLKKPTTTQTDSQNENQNDNAQSLSGKK